MCRGFRIVPIIGLRLSSTALIVILTGVMYLLGTCSGRGQPLPQASQRTATWYAENPTVLDYVTGLCREDPGRLQRDPDCINAAQARLIVAQREAEQAARLGTVRRSPYDTTPPTSPRYWQDRPEERRQKLAYCARMTAEAQARFFCAAARAAEGLRRS